MYELFCCKRFSQYNKFGFVGIFNVADIKPEFINFFQRAVKYDKKSDRLPCRIFINYSKSDSRYT